MQAAAGNPNGVLIFFYFRAQSAHAREDQAFIEAASDWDKE
jgi:hypothetical protein